LLTGLKQFDEGACPFAQADAVTLDLKDFPRMGLAFFLSELMRNNRRIQRCNSCRNMRRMVQDGAGPA
jgi:hypothetical protein